MITKLSQVLAIAWITPLMIVSCSWMPEQFYDNGVSDAEYVSIACLHPAAHTFIDLFPLYETYVDRSGKLAVDFMAEKRLPTDTTQNWEGIRLRIFINATTNQLADAFIQCNNEIVKINLEKYLEQYFTNEFCP